MDLRQLYLGHLMIGGIICVLLLIKVLILLFFIKRKDSQEAVKRKTKYLDWFFVVMIALSGLILSFVLKRFEPYHFIKILGLCVVVFFLRSYKGTVYFVSVLLVLILSVGIMVLSVKKPAFTAPDHADTAEGIPQIVLGQSLYAKHCTECHGADGKLGKFGAMDLSVSHIGVERKKNTILNGRPVSVMRSFKNELSANDIDAVVAYIETLVIADPADDKQ
jgi:cytochrome c6